jgi:2-polyprenyl-3-methyl-5-hydroxy-6-metoxy-1,4-benzoquinol methylase
MCRNDSPPAEDSRSSLRAVTASSYREALWSAVPPGAVPSDFALRSRFLLERVRAGERVLDVGCGEGLFAGELARAGASVVGIDVAREPLRRARAGSPQLDVRLVEEDGPLELDDASFDVVWAGDVIEHVLDTAAWLSELRRVLRSGGRLLISTPAHAPLRMLALAASPRAFAAHFDPRADHVRFYSARTLRALLADFGFHDVRIQARAGPPLARRVLLASATRARF